MIQASRSLLDAAEGLVDDPTALQGVLGTLGGLAQAAASRLGLDAHGAGDDDGGGRRQGPADHASPEAPGVAGAGAGRRRPTIGPPAARSGGAVAVITEAAIRELAGIRGEAAPITSCYLDVDGRRLIRHQDVEHELDAMLREARQRANGHRSVHDDLRRIEAYVRGRPRPAAPPAAWPSSPARRATSGRSSSCRCRCARSSSSTTRRPSASSSRSCRSTSRSACCWPTSSGPACSCSSGGLLVERSELIDELPRDYDSPRRAGAGHARRPRGGAGPPAPAPRGRAPPSTCGRPTASTTSPSARPTRSPASSSGRCTRTCASAGLRAHPGGRGRAGHARCSRPPRRSRPRSSAGGRPRSSAALREAAITGRRGVAGLARTLEALHERRVERLVVSKGYSEEGWRCPETRRARAGRPDATR